MKELRFLMLGLVICLATGVKAQFYDGADDIYYYVLVNEEKDNVILNYGLSLGPRAIKNGKINKKIDQSDAYVYIFNFDGNKAAELTGYYTGESVKSVKASLSSSPSYYEDKVETTDYDWHFVSSTSEGIKYKKPSREDTFIFSTDRNSLYVKRSYSVDVLSCEAMDTYKRVDKSFFKVGRSRTTSGTMHE